MKSEHRHELQTNSLAQTLGTQIEQNKPYLGWALLAVIVVVGGSFVWLMYENMNQQKEAAAWSSYYMASGRGDADNLAPIIEDFPDSTATGWARQAVADSQLLKGTDALLVDREEGKELLGKAVSGYEEILGTSSDPDLLKRARLGLGLAKESLGDLTAATAAFEEVAKLGEEDAFADYARKRLLSLKNDSTKSFYTWFEAQKPAPKPQLNLPPNLGDIPGLPNMSLPPVPSSGGTASDAASSSTAPANLNLPTPPPADAPAAPPADAPAAPPADAPAAPPADAPAAPPADAPAAPPADPPAGSGSGQ